MNSNKINSNKKFKIIVTDSGLGGLSVHALIEKKLSNHSSGNFELIFFNALADSNYGYNSIKSKQDKLLVFDNALAGMLNLTPDIILIACNTLSTLYNETESSKKISIPVLGIVESGIEIVLDNVKNKKEYGIIILGTPTTIDSEQHKRKLIDSGIPENLIVTQPCKNLESEIQNDPNGEKVKELIQKYLTEAMNKIYNKSAHQFILFACTHYGYSVNIFSEILHTLFGKNFTILNPNEKMADLLNFNKIKNNNLKCKVNVRVLSRVKLTSSQIKNLSQLLKGDSIRVSEALEKYEYLPDLFHFNKLEIKN